MRVSDEWMPLEEEELEDELEPLEAADEIELMLRGRAALFAGWCCVVGCMPE